MSGETFSPGGASGVGGSLLPSAPPSERGDYLCKANGCWVSESQAEPPFTLLSRAWCTTVWASLSPHESWGEAVGRSPGAASARGGCGFLSTGWARRNLRREAKASRSPSGELRQTWSEAGEENAGVRFLPFTLWVGAGQESWGSPCAHAEASPGADRVRAERSAMRGRRSASGARPGPLSPPLACHAGTYSG